MDGASAIRQWRYRIRLWPEATKTTVDLVTLVAYHRVVSRRTSSLGLGTFFLILLVFPSRARPAASSVVVRPGDNLQRIVDATSNGTTFLLAAGVHRLRSIRPKSGDKFVGEPGTVLSGARVLTVFAKSGDYWVATGQRVSGSPYGMCQTGFDRCGYPEELFIDDQRLHQESSLADVHAGSWFFDRDSGLIYLADSPAQRRVELSVNARPFEPVADNVTLAALTIEKYANPAQQGAIDAGGTNGWVIARNQVRWNHGIGIRIGNGAQVMANLVHHNGQLGIAGGGNDVVVDSNEIAFNNQARFDPQWEAGGTKFVGTARLTVRSNWVHHNIGPGLWTDADNIQTLYESNTVEDNEWAGILHEISYAAVIRNNIVQRNGFGFAEWIWGAGIVVAASPNVEVAGNRVENNADGIAGVQQARGNGAYGPHSLSNLWVHDNVITMGAGWTGIVQDIGDDEVYFDHDNRFERNQYFLAPGKLLFAWLDGERSDSEWRRFGQDVDGTFAITPP